MITVSYTDNISKDIAKFKKEVNQLSSDSLVEFKSLTPIRSGNARRNTKLSRKTIVADYAYAERLDEGYSKQAPSGMTAPFEKWLTKQIKKIFGK